MVPGASFMNHRLRFGCCVSLALFFQTMTFTDARAEQTDADALRDVSAGFGDPDISRAELLRRFQAIATTFPCGKHTAEVAKTVAILQNMIAEDAGHERTTAKPM